MEPTQRAVREEIFRCIQAITQIIANLSATQTPSNEMMTAAVALDGWNSRLFTATLALNDLK